MNIIRMTTIHETWKMSMGCIGHMAMQSPEDDDDDDDDDDAASAADNN